MNPILFELPAFSLWGIEFKSIAIRYYGLMYAIAYYLCIYLSRIELKKRGKDPNIANGAAFYSLLFGILGARLYYVFLEWDNFKDNPLDVINVFKGISGLAIHGGIIGGATALIIFSILKKVDVFEAIDIGGAVLLIGQAIGRIGNFANGEAHGVPTFTPWRILLNGTFTEWWQEYISNPFAAYYPKLVPWGIVFPLESAAGMQFPGYPTHPTMFYEMILNTIGFCILYLYFLRKRKGLAKGTIGGLYLIFYGVIRTIVSIFRADDLYFMGIKAPHIANVSIIILGTIIIYLRNRKYSIEDGKNSSIKKG